MTPEQIVDYIRRRRLPLGSEKELQAEFAKALDADGIPYERERRLDRRDVIDFMFPGGAGLEFKIKGSPRSHYAQVRRYCERPEVTSVILATNVAMGLPPEIEGKPAYLVSLGRGWL